MATISAQRAKPTVPGEIRWYPMAATQTFKKGAFVYINPATGYLTECAADPVSTGIAGMAEAAALDCAAAANFGGATTTTTAIACPITLAKRGQQFTVQVSSNGSATTTAITDVGAQYSLFVGSSTTASNSSYVHYVDKADVTNKVFIVDAIASEDTVGDTNGRLIVEVRAKYSQLDAGTS